MSYLDDTFGAGTHDQLEAALAFRLYTATVEEEPNVLDSVPVMHITWYLGEGDTAEPVCHCWFTFNRTHFATDGTELEERVALTIDYLSIEAVPWHQSRFQGDHERGGFVSQLSKITPSFWGSRGVTHMKTAITPPNRHKFDATGINTDQDAHQITPLNDPEHPFVQYATWRQGEGPEPEWHS